MSNIDTIRLKNPKFGYEEVTLRKTEGKIIQEIKLIDSDGDGKFEDHDPANVKGDASLFSRKEVRDFLEANGYTKTGYREGSTKPGGAAVKFDDIAYVNTNGKVKIIDQNKQVNIGSIYDLYSKEESTDESSSEGTETKTENKSTTSDKSTETTKTSTEKTTTNTSNCFPYSYPQANLAPTGWGMFGQNNVMGFNGMMPCSDMSGTPLHNAWTAMTMGLMSSPFMSGLIACPGYVGTMFQSFLRGIDGCWSFGKNTCGSKEITTVETETDAQKTERLSREAKGGKITDTTKDNNAAKVTTADDSADKKVESENKDKAVVTEGEPAKVEPTKVETKQATKYAVPTEEEFLAGLPAKVEPEKIETAKTESAKTESAKIANSNEDKKTTHKHTKGKSHKSSTPKTAHKPATKANSDCNLTPCDLDTKLNTVIEQNTKLEKEVKALTKKTQYSELVEKYRKENQINNILTFTKVAQALTNPVGTAIDYTVNKVKTSNNDNKAEKTEKFKLSDKPLTLFTTKFVDM